jgi:hypothetical protein
MNLSGLVIIGPGSEWFWSMAQFFAVVITLLGIYRQLRAQGAANALQKMQFRADRWDSDRMTHARLATALHLKYERPGPGMEPAMVEVADFWETIAGLLEDGHLRLRDVASWGRSVQMWWALMTPAIMAERAHQRVPVYDSWERLDKLMRVSETKAGFPFQLDATTLPRILDDVIRINTGRLRIAQEVNAGVIPTAPKPVVARESE